jgi:fatty-acid desaturase
LLKAVDWKSMSKTKKSNKVYSIKSSHSNDVKWQLKFWLLIQDLFSFLWLLFLHIFFRLSCTWLVILIIIMVFWLGWLEGGMGFFLGYRPSNFKLRVPKKLSSLFRKSFPLQIQSHPKDKDIQSKS